jgi:hypothetical protein
MAIDQMARARAAWPILVEQVRSGCPPLTYKQLCTPLGYHYRAADFFLNEIQRQCLHRGWPNLAAFAVNGQTKLPGAGYAGSKDRKTFEQDLESVRQHKTPMECPF